MMELSLVKTAPALTDSEWLRLCLSRIGRQLYPADAVMFTERVGIKIDSGMDEPTARDQAFREYYC